MTELMQHVDIRCGDALELLCAMPDESVNCCVTSPPYLGLRNYGNNAQIGLEATSDAYVSKLVDVFREVQRVLRKDGTVWLNLADSFATGNVSEASNNHPGRRQKGTGQRVGIIVSRPMPPGFKPKDLIPISWMTAIALQQDGWWLRCPIIWDKRNGMPSSVRDRPTINHEYIFMLTKSARYWYDADAIAEPAKEWSGRAATFDRSGNDVSEHIIPNQSAAQHRYREAKDLPDGQKNIRANRDKQRGFGNRTHDGFNALVPSRVEPVLTKNKRSVWSCPTAAYSDGHFAVFPPRLIEPCVLAGCPAGGTVLDPFAGSGTTGGVAVAHGRKAILLELNPDYVKLMPARIEAVVRGLRDAPKPEVPVGMQTLFEQ